MNRSSFVRVIASLGAAAIAALLLLWSDHREPVPVDELRTPAPAPKANADVEACAKRLAKLGKALRLYADDNDGAFPIGETPSAADEWLPKRLKALGIARADSRCPTAGEAGPPYVYHCYEALEAGDWPRWMPTEHIVTVGSDPGTWLVSDVLERDGPGPHSATEKAFNYLTADGRVTFHIGRPRDVYK